MVSDSIDLSQNCSLIEFFNYLESVALELPASEEVEEFDTRLDESRVLGAAHAQIEQFKDCLPEDIGKKKSAAARKRKVVADDSGINWEELYRSDALEDCTLPDLKKYLRAVGEKLSGKKADIISRVTEHIKVKLEKKQNGDIVKMET